MNTGSIPARTSRHVTRGAVFARSDVHLRHPWRRTGGSLHHHESTPLKVFDKPLRRDPRHHVVGGMDAPSPLEPQRECERLCEFIRRSGAKGFMVGHGERYRHALNKTRT